MIVFHFSSIGEVEAVWAQRACECEAVPLENSDDGMEEQQTRSVRGDLKGVEKSNAAGASHPSRIVRGFLLCLSPLGGGMTASARQRSN